jgi:hypothetical protein
LDAWPDAAVQCKCDDDHTWNYRTGVIVIIALRLCDAGCANDVASHPPGCTCAVHLAWRKKAVGAG